MKRWFFLLPLLAFAACAPSTGDDTPAAYQAAPDKTVLKGYLTNAKHDTMYLIDPSTEPYTKLDSSIANDSGIVAFDATIPHKGFYIVQKNQQNFAMFILGPNEPVTTFHADATRLSYSYTVTNNKESSDYIDFNNKLIYFQVKAQRIQQADDSIKQVISAIIAQPTTTLKMKDSLLDQVYQPFYEKTNKNYFAAVDSARTFMLTFIRERQGSFVTASAVRMIDPFVNIGLYDSTMKALKAKYPTSTDVLMLEKMVNDARPLAKGKPAPDIKLMDPEGKERSLSSLKGKVVLVDFWASWCGPCLMEMPNVIDAYNKYHAKGFEVFSVSLDSNKTQWTSCIQRYKMSWPNHVSDLKRWKSSVVGLYKFNQIPSTYLIDKDGNIEDKNLHGQALQDKLESLFGDNKSGNKP